MYFDLSPVFSGHGFTSGTQGPENSEFVSEHDNSYGKCKGVIVKIVLLLLWADLYCERSSHSPWYMLTRSRETHQRRFSCFGGQLHPIFSIHDDEFWDTPCCWFASVASFDAQCVVMIRVYCLPTSNCIKNGDQRQVDSGLKHWHWCDTCLYWICTFGISGVWRRSLLNVSWDWHVSSSHLSRQHEWSTCMFVWVCRKLNVDEFMADANALPAELMKWSLLYTALTVESRDHSSFNECEHSPNRYIDIAARKSSPNSSTITRYWIP